MNAPLSPAARARRGLALTTALGALALAVATLGAAATDTARHAPQPGLVVSTAWLAEHLRDPDLVLLHVGEKEGYDAQHLPGARFVQLRDIAADKSTDSLSLEMPPADDLRQKLERLGISDDSRVVVYYAKDWVSPATRVIFTLDYFGLGARTSLLDGGMGAWKKEGRPTTSELPPARTGTLSARAPRPLTVDWAWIQKHASARGTKVVDARAPVFYDGPPHMEHRAGHVPGAVNIPFSLVANDDLYMESPDKLEQMFRSAGVQPGDTVAAYCHIGQQATAVLFAARLAGHPVRLYDGSFEDWSRRKDLPTEGGRK